MNLRHVNMEKKTTHDTHARKVREKDRDLRSLKKAELQLKVGQDNLQHMEMLHEKAKANLELVPKDDGTLLNKRQELHREVEQTKRGLAQQVRTSRGNRKKTERGVQGERKKKGWE